MNKKDYIIATYFMCLTAFMIIMFAHILKMEERLNVKLDELYISNDTGTEEDSVQLTAGIDISDIDKLEQVLSEVEEPVADVKQENICVVSEPETEEETIIEESVEEETYIYEGSVLTKSGGINYSSYGHNETWYNLPMSGVIRIAKEAGIEGEYWIRDDGVKMYGNYVIVAADLDIFPRGSIVETSLGLGIVLDTGDFIYYNHYQFDIAVDW